MIPHQKEEEEDEMNHHHLRINALPSLHAYYTMRQNQTNSFNGLTLFNIHFMAIEFI